MGQSLDKEVISDAPPLRRSLGAADELLTQRDAEAFRLVAAPDARSVTGYERFGKPVLDRVLALMFLLLIVPVLVAIAIAVAISVGLPIILRQQRVGRDEKVFSLHKFRTMHPDRRVVERARAPRRRPPADAQASGRSRGSPASVGCCASGASTSCRNCGTYSPGS